MKPQTLLNTSRPNILIILMESFSANAVGAVGGDSVITPNLNRLSREGVLLRICMPIHSEQTEESFQC